MRKPTFNSVYEADIRSLCWLGARGQLADSHRAERLLKLFPKEYERIWREEKQKAIEELRQMQVPHD